MHTRRCWLLEQLFEQRVYSQWEQGCLITTVSQANIIIFLVFQRKRQPHHRQNSREFVDPLIDILILPLDPPQANFPERKEERKRVFFLLQAGNLFLLYYYNDFKPSSIVKFAELYLMACLVFLIVHWCFIHAAWTEVAGFRGGN